MDNTARLWDASGHELAVLRGHKGPVYSAVFSPAWTGSVVPVRLNGTHLITTSMDNTARLWMSTATSLRS